MADKKARKIYTFPAPVNNPFADRGENGYCVQSLSFGSKAAGNMSTLTPIEIDGEAYDGFKFELWVRLPQIPEECAEALNAELQEQLGPEMDWLTLIERGIKTCMYGCSVSDFDSVMKPYAEGNYEDAQAAAQQVYNDYVVGRKASGGGGTTQKVKAKKMTEMEKQAAELGMTADEIFAAAVAAKRAEMGLDQE